MRPWWLGLLLVACQFDPRGVAANGGSPDATAGTTPDAPAGAIDAAPPDAAHATACPTSYDGSNGSSRYRFVTGAKSWADAEADCADDAAPFTSLAIIGDYGENFYVDTFSSNRDIWLGIDDQAREGTWVDVFDQPVGFTSWSWGEPSNGGDPSNVPGEDCGEMYDGGFWNDLDCTQQLRYVCECDLSR